MRNPAIGYASAVVLEVVATLVTLVLVRANPSLAVRNVLPFMVVFLVAFAWGTGPAVLATLFGGILLYYAILPPSFSFGWTTTNAVSMLVFLLVGLAFTYGASRVEHARRTAEALASELQATFDAMADSIVVYDAQGRIMHVNDAGRKLLSGATAATLDHMDHQDMSSSEQRSSDFFRDAHGQTFLPEQRPVARLLRGEVLSGSDEVDASPARGNDSEGDEIILSVGGAPIRGPNKRINGAVLVARDVTSRRRLERRTHEALQALLAMAQVLVSGAAGPDADENSEVAEVDAAPLQIVARRLADLTRNVLGCSRVAITMVDPATDAMRPLAVVGLTPEQEAHMWATQPLDVRLSDALAPEQMAQLCAGETLTTDLGEENLAAERNPYHARAVLLAPCLLGNQFVGNQLVGLLTIDYASDPHGYTSDEIALACAVARFLALVIERKRLIRERAEVEVSALALSEANRRMSEFITIASHELKTPLTYITSSVQLLERQLERATAAATTTAPDANVEDTARLAQTLRTLLPAISRGKTRLNRLVDELLDVSRVREGKLEYRFEQHDLAMLVQGVVAEQRQQQPDRTINLEIIAPGPVSVAMDADRIDQVTMNYLTNALKYSLKDCPVDVMLEVVGSSNTARVSVRDQGQGMPADEQAHIWELFHRVPGVEVLTGSGVGLGLGLYICRTIIERHGGQVGVESTQGLGSTFWFTLPLAQSDRNRLGTRD
ncbi:MAG TPA: ATP-binding protein [Ktedonobacterales bacterium]